MDLKQIASTNDVNLLKESLFALHNDYSKSEEKYKNIISLKDEKIKSLSAQFQQLYNDFKLAAHHRYGRSTEKYSSPNQLSLELFDEAGDILPTILSRCQIIPFILLIMEN